MEKPKLEIVKPSKNLEKYMEAKALQLSNLADAYLEISRCSYNLLCDYPLDWKGLKEGYPQLFTIMQIIQEKPTIISAVPEQDRDDRNRITANKDQASKDIDLCISLMLNLNQFELEHRQFDRENKLSKRNFILTIVAIFITEVSVLASIFI